jgi:nucleoside-diphosphate-sugar epimerase
MPTVLILGAHGRLGAAAAQAFAAAGWRVLQHGRRATPGWLNQPLADTEALAAAAAGAQVVLYAVNPLYTQWPALLLPLARQGMDLAQRLGALFMLPGNVYNFGDDLPALLTEDTPEHPNHEKAALRIQLEREMAERAQAPQPLHSVVLRAGDFFGAGSGSWMDLAIAKSLRSKGRLVYPGPLDLPHAWAYLPDLAQAFVALATRPPLARHSRWHFAGHTLTGQQLLEGLANAAVAQGLPRPRTSVMPWWPIQLAAPFAPMLRALLRMRYLWQRPHALAGERLAAHCGPLPHTPLAAALAATVAQL